MKRSTWCIAFALLFLQSSRLAEASCIRNVNSTDLVEYDCEGGSVIDLYSIPENVEKIHIRNMPIYRIADTTFSRFKHLIILICSNCYIEDIDDNAFAELRELQQLILDSNQLRTVKAVWFRSLTSLNYLDLNYNKIEKIDGDVFANAPELVDLRISGNRLQCLDFDGLSRLKNLKQIFLNENPDFGCPNAAKNFFRTRQVNFEGDDTWNNILQDRISASTPIRDFEPTLPTTRFWPRPSYPETTTTTTTYWRPEPTTTTTTEAPYTPPTMIYTPAREIHQPMSPNGDFTMNTYREPTVQHPGNYVNNNTTQNITTIVNATTPKVLLAGHAAAAAETTTTECPLNSASQLLSRESAIVFSLMAMIIALLSC